MNYTTYYYIHYIFIIYITSTSLLDIAGLPAVTRIETSNNDTAMQQDTKTAHKNNA